VSYGADSRNTIDNDNNDGSNFNDINDINDNDVARSDERGRRNGVSPRGIGSVVSRDSHSWVGREDDYVLMVTEADASDALEEMAHEGKSTALAWSWISSGAGFVLGLLFSVLLALGILPGALLIVLVWIAYMALALPYGVNSDFFGPGFDD
jgi:hypothetical protein